MSERDKLDVYMDMQAEVNQNLMRTVAAMSDTLQEVSKAVTDLEKHTVKTDMLAATVKEHGDEIVEIRELLTFVKDAKRVFHAALVALVLGAGAVFWQLVAPPKPTPDVEALIKLLSQPKTQAPQTRGQP